MLKKLLNFKVSLLLLVISLVGLSFLVFALNQENYSYDLNLAKKYAPDFWFDSEEKYYPCDYSEFYYDKNGDEVPGDIAVSNYNRLTKEEKLNHFKVFYKVKNESEETVIEYWLFYVKDEFINNHYGDAESIFVFLDNFGKVEKVIASEHWGDKFKALLANAELDNPRINHIRILVEKGSHANWIDGNENGMVDRSKDISNWYNSYGSFLFSDWSIDDKINGVKMRFNDFRYHLIPLYELQRRLKERERLIKSPELGMPIFGYYLHLGGEPADLAAIQDKVENPERVIPFTSRLARKKIADKWNIVKNKVKDTVSRFKQRAKEFGGRMKSFLSTSSFWSARVSENHSNKRVQKIVESGEKPVFSTKNSPVENLEKQVNKRKKPQNVDFPADKGKITALDLQELEKEVKSISRQVSRLQDRVNSLQGSQDKRKGEKNQKDNQEEKEDSSYEPKNLSENLFEERKLPAYSSLPSPGVSLVSFSLGNGQNDKQSQEENEGQGSGNNDFPIVINEVFFDAEGGDEENEFIELFNQSDKEIDISNWSLQYLSGNADSLGKIKRKNFEEGDKIFPKGYFLVGVNGRKGDMEWKSLSLSNKGATIFLVRNQGPESDVLGPGDEDIVDRIAYGQGSGLIFPEKGAVSLGEFQPGESIGRKWDSIQQKYQDTDNNSLDFELQTPTPGTENQSIENPPSPPENLEIVIENAESVLSFVFGDNSSDIEDPTDALSQSLEEAYISHTDSSFALGLTVSSDVIDPHDAPSQNILEAYISYGESSWSSFLMEELFGK